jgi:hypothetical protein
LIPVRMKWPSSVDAPKNQLNLLFNPCQKGSGHHQLIPV